VCVVAKSDASIFDRQRRDTGKNEETSGVGRGKVILLANSPQIVVLI
jgi:hypothetical protein